MNDECGGKTCGILPRLAYWVLEQVGNSLAAPETESGADR
jgi:hypothetical protein